MDPTPQVERGGIVKPDDSLTRKFVFSAIKRTGTALITFAQRWEIAG
ncbi:MAG: hypothetical protein P1U77_19285 [Rubripirellula sp.]|nr:hypothetical protein [Rubripirellula sp.]